MSYTVEPTENGFIETLELDGVKYYKEWEFTDYGAESNSKDFCEQLEENGETNNALLDRIYDALDSSNIAYDFAYIKKVYM